MRNFLILLLTYGVNQYFSTLKKDSFIVKLIISLFMGKKNKKPKKVSVKKLKYAVFHKDKPAAVNIVPKELTHEEQKNVVENDLKIGSFLRGGKNPPTKEVNKRRMLSKR